MYIIYAYGSARLLVVSFAPAMLFHFVITAQLLM